MLFRMTRPIPNRIYGLDWCIADGAGARGMTGIVQVNSHCSRLSVHLACDQLDLLRPGRCDRFNA